MLLEPSSGSYMMTYLPRRDALGQSIGCSSSSDATTHTRPVGCTAWRTVAGANRSSFCCRSPETFTAPESAAPRMSLKPARRTWREMILAARHRSYSRLESSPVASGWSRSCSMMKRSIVMTDVDVLCTLAVGVESDRAISIGPQDRYAVGRQPGHDLGRGVTVVVVCAHADHREPGPQFLEPRVRRRRAGTVVAHLEHGHGPHPSRQPRLDRQAGVGLTQETGVAERRPQHHAIPGHLYRRRHPAPVGAHPLERAPVQRGPLS